MAEIFVPASSFETFRGVVFPWFCDNMGHMATQHYMGLYDHALLQVMGKMGPLVGQEGDTRLGWADISHDIRYLHELFAGDLVAVRSVFLRFGRSSVTYRNFMIRCSDGLVCSTLEAVTVRLDLTRRKAYPIDDSHIEAARPFMAEPED